MDYRQKPSTMRPDTEPKKRRRRYQSQKTQKTALQKHWDRCHFEDHCWYIGRASKHHICTDKELFKEYKTTTDYKDITGKVIGIGTVTLFSIIPDGSLHKFDLLEVLHIPEAPAHMISLPRANSRGFSFDTSSCVL